MRKGQTLFTEKGHVLLFKATNINGHWEKIIFPLPKVSNKTELVLLVTRNRITDMTIFAKVIL